MASDANPQSIPAVSAVYFVVVSILVRRPAQLCCPWRRCRCRLPVPRGMRPASPCAAACMRCVKAGRMGTRLRWPTLVFAPWVKPHHRALPHSFLCLLLCLGQMPSLPAIAPQIGLATITVGGLWPSTRLPSLPLPYTALQLVFGLLVGFCNVAGGAVAYISGALLPLWGC